MQGAQNVRCARCGEITPVPVAGGSTIACTMYSHGRNNSHSLSFCAANNSAQLACSNPQCRVVLMYPRGASQVQCSLCGTINNSMQVRAATSLVVSPNVHLVCSSLSCTQLLCQRYLVGYQRPLFSSTAHQDMHAACTQQQISADKQAQNYCYLFVNGTRM